jgi:hypothetical protein
MVKKGILNHVSWIVDAVQKIMKGLKVSQLKCNPKLNLLSVLLAIVVAEFY